VFVFLKTIIFVFVQ